MAVKDIFFGNSHLRNALLADIKAEGLLSRLWLKPDASGSVIDVLVSQYNVDRSLLKLLSVLAGSRLDEISTAFLGQALEAIPLDKTSDGIVARWLLEICVPAIESRLAGTAGSDALATIVALVQRSCTEAIDAREWQSARRSMIFLEGLSPLQAAYADVAAAMTWDLSRFPNAIENVVEAWEESIRKESFLSEGWTDESDANFQDLLVDAHGHVLEKIQDKRAAGEQLEGDYLGEMLQAHFEAQGKLDLFLRANRLRGDAEAAADQWLSERQREYVLFVTHAVGPQVSPTLIGRPARDQLPPRVGGAGR